MYPVQQNFLRTAIGQCRKIAVFTVPLTAALLLLVFGEGIAKPPTPPFSGSVPRAVCSPGDRPETGLQGETTLANVTSGAVYDGFNCNLELVGTFEGEGASFGFTWFKDCAYYGTGGGRGAP